MSVVCYAFRGHCDGPIPRPEELYKVCVCVIESDQGNADPLHLQWAGRTGSTKRIEFFHEGAEI